MATNRKSNKVGTFAIIAAVCSLFWGVPAVANAANATTQMVYTHCTVLFAHEEEGVETVFTDKCGELVITKESVKEYVDEGQQYDFKADSKTYNIFGERPTITLALIH